MKKLSYPAKITFQKEDGSYLVEFPDLPECHSAKITFQKKDKSYLVKFPDLPGCLTEGKTLADAVENAEEALLGYLESVFERKTPPRILSIEIGRKKRLLSNRSNKKEKK